MITPVRLMFLFFGWCDGHVVVVVYYQNNRSKPTMFFGWFDGHVVVVVYYQNNRSKPTYQIVAVFSSLVFVCWYFFVWRWFAVNINTVFMLRRGMNERTETFQASTTSEGVVSQCSVRLGVQGCFCVCVLEHT